MKQIWFDSDKPFKERAKALVEEMTLEEKVSQLNYQSKSIDRLGIPDYNWWNECLHGVARAGVATVFPQAIGMAASFNSDLMNQVAVAISDEARAKHHEAKRQNDNGIYKGLTYWSPNINIFRDPRWGRGHETYGEDPYLTSRMGIAFCKGLQGDDDKYLKLVATIKHFAVHSGPEADRHRFNAVANIKDMKETYLAAFEACVKEANVYSVMGAYNRTNGEACCASKTLLQDILRDEWGFDGIVVSDCGAIKDIYHDHHLVETPAEAAALAVKNGCEINCGFMYPHLLEAVDQGFITEKEIDIAVYRAMLTRMKLGMFDDDELVPYAAIPYGVNDSEEHHEISKQMSRESIVMLKNDKMLPVDLNTAKTIAVIGPNADNKRALIGNYYGVPSSYTTILDGVRQVAKDANVIYAPGCSLADSDEAAWGEKPSWGYAEAVSAANMADVVILVLGLTAELEGEESAMTGEGGDKTDIYMSPAQEGLMEEITALGKPTVLVNMTGSCMDLRKSEESCNAILQAWYPGQFGGLAIAEAIFGEYSPSGKLPITFYNDMTEIPDFSDYSMENRTYKFFKGKPLYPFGYGLSYGSIEYYDLMLSTGSISIGDDIRLSIKCINRGTMDVKDTVQIYLKDDDATARVPKYKLVDFKKVDLPIGVEKEVSFTVKSKDMAIITDDGQSEIQLGSFTLFVGGSQPDIRSSELLGYDPLSAKFLIE